MKVYLQLSLSLFSQDLSSRKPGDPKKIPLSTASWRLSKDVHITRLNFKVNDTAAFPLLFMKAKWIILSADIVFISRDIKKESTKSGQTPNTKSFTLYRELM